MQTPFAELAEAARELASCERKRLQMATDLMRRDGKAIETTPAIAFAGWIDLVAKIEEIAQVLAILSPQELSVRRLDALLERPIPTLWKR